MVVVGGAWWWVVGGGGWWWIVEGWCVGMGVGGSAQVPCPRYGVGALGGYTSAGAPSSPPNQMLIP